MKRKRSLATASVLAALMAISSVALADHEEPRDEDTIVSFGYDALNDFLALNSGDNDTPWICDFSNGPLTAGYGEDGDEPIIASLEGEGGEWEFAPRDEKYVSHENELAEDPSPYSDGQCELVLSSIAGPNGQRNHGQFVKAAKSLLGDMKGHGCIVREFAQSDIGKGGELDDIEEGFDAGEEGEIQFTTFSADCNKPNKKVDKGERGKSADAPGHNKGD